MADDEYDFSGITQLAGAYTSFNGMMNGNPAHEDEEDDEDFPYFWTDRLPHEIAEKLIDINRVFQEDATPINMDRPRKITFNKRVRVRDISLQRLNDNEDKPDAADQGAYSSSEQIRDSVANITADSSTPAAETSDGAGTRTHDPQSSRATSSTSDKRSDVSETGRPSANAASSVLRSNAELQISQAGSSTSGEKTMPKVPKSGVLKTSSAAAAAVGASSSQGQETTPTSRVTKSKHAEANRAQDTEAPVEGSSSGSKPLRRHSKQSKKSDFSNAQNYQLNGQQLSKKTHSDDRSERAHFFFADISHKDTPIECGDVKSGGLKFDPSNTEKTKPPTSANDNGVKPQQETDRIQDRLSEGDQDERKKDTTETHLRTGSQEDELELLDKWKPPTAEHMLPHWSGTVSAKENTEGTNNVHDETTDDIVEDIEEATLREVTTFLFMTEHDSDETANTHYSSTDLEGANRVTNEHASAHSPERDVLSSVEARTLQIINRQSSEDSAVSSMDERATHINEACPEAGSGDTTPTIHSRPTAIACATDPSLPSNHPSKQQQPAEESSLPAEPPAGVWTASEDVPLKSQKTPVECCTEEFSVAPPARRVSLITKLLLAGKHPEGLVDQSNLQSGAPNEFNHNECRRSPERHGARSRSPYLKGGGGGHRERLEQNIEAKPSTRSDQRTRGSSAQDSEAFIAWLENKKQQQKLQRQLRKLKNKAINDSGNGAQEKGKRRGAKRRIQMRTNMDTTQERRLDKYQLQGPEREEISESELARKERCEQVYNLWLKKKRQQEKLEQSLQQLKQQAMMEERQDRDPQRAYWEWLELKRLMERSDVRRRGTAHTRLALVRVSDIYSTSAISTKSKKAQRDIRQKRPL